VDKLRTVFNSIDVDGDQQLTHMEIQQAMAGAGETISAKSLRAVIRATDKNGSGSVNFQDFVTIVAARQKVTQKKSVFHFFTF
jgi:Ca2+-binding EF-hand superfamily protein